MKEIEKESLVFPVIAEKLKLFGLIGKQSADGYILGQFAFQAVAVAERGLEINVAACHVYRFQELMKLDLVGYLHTNRLLYENLMLVENNLLTRTQYPTPCVCLRTFGAVAGAFYGVRSCCG